MVLDQQRIYIHIFAAFWRSDDQNVDQGPHKIPTGDGGDQSQAKPKPKPKQQKQRTDDDDYDDYDDDDDDDDDDDNVEKSPPPHVNGRASDIYLTLFPG
jgi:hypothetical protein